jgi:murein DD-endopeptidase MepM/ murein hydrolase activator NlpD
MRLDRFVAAAVLSAGLAAAAYAAVPGGIEVVTLPDDAQRATYENRPVLIVRQPRPTAVVGISLNAAPGKHVLVIESTSNGRIEHPFTVTKKAYPVQRLTLADDKMVNPPAEVLARIERETTLMNEQYARFTDLAASPFPMTLPAVGPVSSNFGLRRILNGQPRSPHAGLDVAAPLGAKVVAPANGTISLTGSFYFNGNTVFIDHGEGLLSMMCHLSKIAVHDGDVVKKGQEVGRVGATGRATGPHLHWSVSLNGDRVDPSAALALFNPKSKTKAEPPAGHQ